LRPRSIYLYLKNGRLKDLADIDHVYHGCEKGLKDKIVFLYRMFNDLRSRDYDMVVVGKAYNDELCAYFREV